MKKQLKNMLELSNKSKSLKINGMFTLRSHCIDSNGWACELSKKEPADVVLYLEYVQKHDKFFGRSYTIKSRTCDEIVKEINEKMTEMLSDIQERLISQLNHGYLLGEVIID